MQEKSFDDILIGCTRTPLIPQADQPLSESTINMNDYLNNPKESKQEVSFTKQEKILCENVTQPTGDSVYIEIPCKHLEKMEALLREKNVSYSVNRINDSNAVSAALAIDTSTSYKLVKTIAKRCDELCKKSGISMINESKRCLCFSKEKMFKL